MLGGAHIQDLFMARTPPHVKSSIHLPNYPCLGGKYRLEACVLAQQSSYGGERRDLFTHQRRPESVGASDDYIVQR